MSLHAPDIFNDVTGPVMRGPSSSHAAGGARIGALVRQAAGGDPAAVTVTFDPSGALAESHDGHGTDMGFACGILGMELTDPRVADWRELIRDAGTDLRYEVASYGAVHPGQYRIELLTRAGKTIMIDAVSSGGGMVELTELDGCRISVRGDYDELILTGCDPGRAETAAEYITGLIPDAEYITASQGGSGTCIQVKRGRPYTDEEASDLKSRFSADDVFIFSPVLPSRSRADARVPFRTASEMLIFNKDRSLEMWELSLLYESGLCGSETGPVWDRMEGIRGVMRSSLENGLAGTVYEGRILPAQSHLMKENADRLVPGDVTNTAIRYITAIMESKSSMGIFCACPTAGSAGCVPGTLLALQDVLRLPDDAVVKGMLAASLIGVFFAEQATFAAEECGCQVECGAASGMAAAGVCQMMGGSAEECADAASFALQAVTGLACDPVANRVEVPCLNKNILGGMNAVSSANVILAGYDKVIPLDETIRAIYDIGKALPLELRCTYGGLGKTDTSNAIRRRLDG